MFRMDKAIELAKLATVAYLTLISLTPVRCLSRMFLASVVTTGMPHDGIVEIALINDGKQ